MTDPEQPFRRGSAHSQEHIWPPRRDKVGVLLDPVAVARRVQDQVRGRLDVRQTQEVVSLMIHTIGAMRDRRIAHHLRDLFELGIDTLSVNSHLDGTLNNINSFFSDALDRGSAGIVDLMDFLRENAPEARVDTDDQRSYSLELGHVEQHADWRAADDLDHLFRTLMAAGQLSTSGYRLGRIHERNDRLASYGVRAQHDTALGGTGSFVVVRKRPIADVVHDDGTVVQIIKRSGFYVVPALFADDNRSAEVARIWRRQPQIHVNSDRGEHRVRYAHDASLDEHLTIAKQRLQSDVQAMLDARSSLELEQRQAARRATEAALHPDDRIFRPGYFPIDALYYGRIQRGQ